MTSNLQKINWCAPQIRYTYIVFIGIFTYSVCVCLYRTWAHFCAILVKRSQTQAKPHPHPHRQTHCPLVWAELGTSRKIPMNHSTNRQALMLRDLYGTPIGTRYGAVCVNKSHSNFMSFTRFSFMMTKKKSDNSRWNAGNMLGIPKCPKLKDLIWLKRRICNSIQPRIEQCE